MSESSSSSSSTADATLNNQAKWDTLYTLRERMLLFVAHLKRRTRLYPPPFYRATVGGDAAVNWLTIQHSHTVSRVAEEYVLGVFYTPDAVATVAAAAAAASTNSGTYLCNYPGWILTQEEYAELNNEHNLNMKALYGVGVVAHVCDKALERQVVGSCVERGSMGVGRPTHYGQQHQHVDGSEGP